MMSLNNTAAITPSWELRVNINEFDIVEQSLLVSGDTHIGGVIMQLVEKLTNIRNDWSDFALWWPDKNLWLNKTKMTLDQYGVQADAILYFTRIHKFIRVQLPDQQILDLNVDFSTSLFYSLKQICKELNMRHPEEMSLLRCVYNGVGSNSSSSKKTNKLKSKTNSKINNTENDKSMTIDSSNSKMINNNKENGSISSGTSTLNNSSNNSNSLNNKTMKFLTIEKSISLSLDNANDSLHSSDHIDQLWLSPIVSTQEYLNRNSIKYKSLFDKTRVNSRWLDSSKSLMEQNIKEDDLVQLKFKYYAFFDLNIKTDLIRTNQIYEQAKWSILSEEIDCTEQELFNFAALQLQIQLQTKSLILKNQNDFSRLSSTDSNTLSKIYLSTNSSINHHNSLSIEDASIGKQSSILIKNDLIEDEDDVDTALSKLEKSLDLVDSTNTTSTNNTSNLISESSTKSNDSTNEYFNSKSNISQSSDQLNNNNNNNNLNSVSSNRLGETLLLMKQQKYTFKKFRPFYFILDDTHYLSYYKSKQESNGRPLDKINLKSCEVVPDVNLANRKFGINLRVPSSDGINELCLRCETEESYANWMSAFKLASKSKSLADQSFSIEAKSILNLLNIQLQKSIKSSNNYLNTINNSQSITKDSSQIKDASYQSFSYNESDNAEVQATNLLPVRILKKYKLKQLNDRILEAYSTISDLDIHESKWRYIKAWQALPTYGISYFTVKIKGSKFREELIGVTSNRLMRISPEGDTIKSWRFNTMKSWNVNWDIKQFEIIFDDEQLTFVCLNCDAKILHEFIGGYIYLSLRQTPTNKSDSASTHPNEDMFFKLTEKR